MQSKITDYEAQVQQLQAELAKVRLDNAIQLALRDAKALDPDYMAFKLREKYKPEELTLDESGKISGMDDKLSALKTQFPTQFDGAGAKKIIENKLPEGNESGMTRESILKMPYSKQVEAYNADPEGFNAAMGAK